MAGAVGRPGRVAGADRALGAVVVVDRFAGENEIALAVAVMLVIAEDRTSGNGHARVKPTLVTELLVEDLLYHYLFATVGAFFHYFLHNEYFTISTANFVETPHMLTIRVCHRWDKEFLLTHPLYKSPTKIRMQH